MRKRLLASAAGGIAGAVTLVGYLTAPMFYSYFDSLALRMPAAASVIYDVWPLSLWLDLRERYEPAAYGNPAAGENLVCRLRGGTRTDIATEDCRLRVEAGDVVFGPYLALPPRSWTATFSFGTAPGCDGGEVEVDVAAGTARVIAARRRLDIAAPIDVELVFDMTLRLLMLADIETRATVKSGCLILERVQLAPL